MNNTLVYRKISDMFVRPCTSDDLVIDEAVDYKALFTNSNNKDVFMDIGCNIGAVSILANKLVPNMIIYSYEPDKENFEIAKKNIMRRANRNNIYNAAMSNKRGDINLYQSNSSNKGKHSTVHIDGFSDGVKVECYNFREELKNVTLIKCDIEGGEYKLDFTYLPDKIKGIAIEIHKIDNDWESMKVLFEILKSQFSFISGDIPDGTNSWFEDRDCFMTIFLRNT